MAVYFGANSVASALNLPQERDRQPDCAGSIAGVSTVVDRSSTIWKLVPFDVIVAGAATFAGAFTVHHVMLGEVDCAASITTRSADCASSNAHSHQHNGFRPSTAKPMSHRKSNIRTQRNEEGFPREAGVAWEAGYVQSSVADIPPEVHVMSIF
jgi:hypothetical protein